jgi:3-oxoadipate enol-lactonase
MDTTLNGVRIAYHDRGQRHSTALLLIHGFPLDHRMWASQLVGLSAEVRVIAPDLRGFGRSAARTAAPLEVTPGPLTMEQHADDLAALLDHLAVERAVVAGLSMGGYIAFAFWRRHPERVQALILLDTRAEPDAPQARANRDAAAVKVRQAGSAAIAGEMLPRLLSPANLSNQRISDEVLTMMSEQPVEGVAGALAGLRDRADSRPTLPTISVPTLVLVGEHDVLTPPADAAAMAAAIPAARIVVIPYAGHLSTLENPRAVNGAMRDFLRAVGGG